MKSVLLLVPALTLILAPGCGGTLLVGSDPDGGQAGSTPDSGVSAEAGGGACTSDSDCQGTQHCGYLVADACAARGQCLPYNTSRCAALGPACACDGTDLMIQCVVIPEGYAVKPIAHLGPCQVLPGDAGNKGDAGSQGDAGAAACVLDSDCAPGSLCGYPTLDGCAAKGQCMASTGGLCNGIQPGCACDGTTFNTICGGLPSGYVSKPMSYDAACIDPGSTFACGNVTCTGAQYCEDTPPGVMTSDGSVPPDFYQCLDLPAACVKNPTCACIEATISPQSSCSTSIPGAMCSGVGQVTIRCQGV